MSGTCTPVYHLSTHLLGGCIEYQLFMTLSAQNSRGHVLGMDGGLKRSPLVQLTFLEFILVQSCEWFSLMGKEKFYHSRIYKWVTCFMWTLCNAPCGEGNPHFRICTHKEIAEQPATSSEVCVWKTQTPRNFSELNLGRLWVPSSV